MSFRTEANLLEVFTKADRVRECFDLAGYDLLYFIEPRGLFGIPDVVVSTLPGSNDTDVTVFAFELKLSNWKRALVQAFRYRSFAEYSFVVLDSEHSAPAIRNLQMFIRADVGLVTLDSEGTVEVHCRPQCRKPYLSDLRERLLASIDDVASRNYAAQSIFDSEGWKAKELQVSAVWVESSHRELRVGSPV